MLRNVTVSNTWISFNIILYKYQYYLKNNFISVLDKNGDKTRNMSRLQSLFYDLFFELCRSYLLTQSF